MIKRTFTTITLAALVFFVGCTDLDEVWSEIDLLKKQKTEQTNELEEQKEQFAALEALLENLEQLTSNANSESPPSRGW